MRAANAKVRSNRGRIGGLSMPEPRQLLPTRPPETPDCPRCVGIGFVLGGVVCPDCEALGWIAQGAA